MGRRACRCMRLRLTARKAICMGRRADRRRCDRRMEEKGRRECAGTRQRRRDGRADMKERVECRGFRLRIMAVEAAAVAAVLRRGVERLRRAPLREMRVRVAAEVGARSPVRGSENGEFERKLPSLCERATFLCNRFCYIMARIKTARR